MLMSDKNADGQTCDVCLYVGSFELYIRKSEG